MASPGGRRRMKPETQHRGRFGGEHCRTVANRGDRIEALFSQSLDGFLNPVEFHCDRVIPPWVVQNVAAVRGQSQIDSQPVRRLRKGANLISGCGGEK